MGGYLTHMPPAYTNILMLVTMGRGKRFLKDKHMKFFLVGWFGFVGVLRWFFFGFVFVWLVLVCCFVGLVFVFVLDRLDSANLNMLSTSSKPPSWSMQKYWDSLNLGKGLI